MKLAAVSLWPMAAIGGGTLFRASADFGRHGQHEDEFFELAGQLTGTVEFIGAPAQIGNSSASWPAPGCVWPTAPTRRISG